VKRVIELEGEVAMLRAEIDRLRAEAQEAVASTHRQYRRDLVPLRQLPDVFSGGRVRR
jgi:MerR family transcriptional regulator/heat shock protein HspR